METIHSFIVAITTKKTTYYTAPSVSTKSPCDSAHDTFRRASQDAQGSGSKMGLPLRKSQGESAEFQDSGIARCRR